MVDLDRFKQLNDTQGHEVGDDYLKLVATTMREALRSEDTVARWGGDEFVVLLEALDTDVASAEVRAQEVVTKLDQALCTDVALRHGVHHGAASIGYALYGGTEADEVESLLKRADGAMYLIKKRRRAT